MAPKKILAAVPDEKMLPEAVVFEGAETGHSAVEFPLAQLDPKRSTRLAARSDSGRNPDQPLWSADSDKQTLVVADGKPGSDQRQPSDSLDDQRAARTPMGTSGGEQFWCPSVDGPSPWRILHLAITKRPVLAASIDQAHPDVLPAHALLGAGSRQRYAYRILF